MAPRVLYLINTLDEGGAERGLVELVRGGAFDGFDLKIGVLAEGSQAQRQPLRALGYDPINLSGAPRLTFASLAKAAGSLRRLLDAWAPEALVLSLPQANLLGRLLSIGRPVLVCSFEHNTRLAKRAYEWGYRLTSSRVDWLLADASTTAAEAERRLYWTEPSQRFVLPLVSFGARSASGPRAAAAPFQIVTAGRLTRTKNHALLIDAVAGLAKAREVTLRIYGDGPQREALEAQVSRLGLGAVVLLPGFDPEWSSHPADLFVLPSRHEGASLATLEAMHAGIPVLAARSGGIVDYGKAVEPIDPADLKPGFLEAAIARLIDDAERRRALLEAGRSLVDQQFGRETAQARLRNFNAALMAKLGS